MKTLQLFLPIWATVFVLLVCPALAQASSQSNGPRFSDLSIWNAQVSKEQFSEELAEKRIHLLRNHKKMGHITFGLMTATVGGAVYGAHEMKDRRAKRNGQWAKSDLKHMHLHMGLAALSLTSYFTTAYFGLRAPKFEGYEDESSRQWHKGLAYIHLPAMILSPILGYLAMKDIHDGKAPDGLAKLHRPIMFAGYGALAASYLSASFMW